MFYMKKKLAVDDIAEKDQFVLLFYKIYLKTKQMWVAKYLLRFPGRAKAASWNGPTIEPLVWKRPK